MKKLLSLYSLLSFFAIIGTSFKPSSVAPKIYPELEAYFKSVETKEFIKEHADGLATIKYYISSSHWDYEDWNLIFYGSENTFGSQASRVFAQTLCYAKNHRKIRAYSAGLTTGEINLKPIEYLTKIGYKITKTENDGKAMYAVRFSDRANPILLFSKTTEDKSLPTKDGTSVRVCDIKK